MLKIFNERVSMLIYTEKATRDAFKKLCTRDGQSMSIRIHRFMEREVVIAEKEARQRNR